MIDENIHVYNTIEHNFSGIRSFDRHMYPVNWELVIKLAGKAQEGISEEDKEAQMRDITVSYQRVKWWLQNFMMDIFACGSTDVPTLEAFFTGDFDNVFVSTPQEPTDSILSEALFKKVSVLSGDNIEVLQVSLKSTDFESTFYFSDKAGYQINMDNSVFEGKSLYTEPWWARYDCDTWEPMHVEGMSNDDLLESLETASDLNQITKLIHDTTYGAAEEGEIEVPDKLTSTIAMADLKWKPTKT